MSFTITVETETKQQTIYHSRTFTFIGSAKTLTIEGIKFTGVKKFEVKEINYKWTDIDNTISNISDEEKSGLDSLAYKETKK